MNTPQQAVPAVGGVTSTANTAGFVTAETRKQPPIGVPFKKTRGTRYEIHRRLQDIQALAPAWTVVAVVVASGARTAIAQWASTQEDLASDELKVYVRAIAVSRITQVAIQVEQRSKLTYS